MHGNVRRLLGAVAAVAVAAAVTAGCSGASSGKSSSASLAEPAMPAGQHGAKGPGAASSTATTPAVDLAVAKRPAGDRKVISTAELQLQAKDIDQTVQRARARSSSTPAATCSPSRRASPATSTPPSCSRSCPRASTTSITGIGGLGKLVQPAASAPKTSPVRSSTSARASPRRRRAPTGSASCSPSSGNVSDLLGVEQQLTTREAQVDSLSGELAAVDAQVYMATITLDVAPLPAHAKPAAAPRPGPGFTRGLRAGSSAFAATARVLEAGFGVALPFAPIALLALAGWWAIRRRSAPGTAPS